MFAIVELFAIVIISLSSGSSRLFNTHTGNTLQLAHHSVHPNPIIRTRKETVPDEPEVADITS